MDEYYLRDITSAIMDLSRYEEFEHMVDELKQKLEEQFKNIKERNGMKKIWKLEYYPNGLCQYRMGNYQAINIVLTPWEAETSLKVSLPVMDLRWTQLFWYYQVKLKLNPKFRLKTMPLKDIKENIDKYNSLSESEKQFIDIKKLKLNYIDCLNNIKELFGRSNNKFSPLTDDEIKYIITILPDRKNLYTRIAELKKKKFIDGIDIPWNGINNGHPNYYASVEEFVNNIDDPIIMDMLKKLKVI